MSEAASLKEAVLPNKYAGGAASSIVLKSDAHGNSTFPLAMALGSALPHTACQSDFAVACAGLVGKNVLVYRTGSRGSRSQLTI